MIGLVNTGSEDVVAQLRVERKKSRGLRWVLLVVVLVAIAAYLAVRSGRTDEVAAPAESTTNR